MIKKKTILNRFVKRPDVRIYCIGYKPAPMPDNSLFTPLEAGACLHDRHFAIRDDMGTPNISYLNPAYAENTAIYWAWKQHPTELKYIGFCQYRRQLSLPQTTDFDKIFSEHAACGAYWTIEELNQGVRTVEEQFCLWHNKKWLDMATEIINTRFAWFAPAWQQYVLNGDKIYASNCFVMKVDDFDQYCRLLFGILDKFMANYGGTVESLKKTIESEIERGEFVDRLSPARGYLYQLFAPAFLAERILTAYIQSLGLVKKLNYKLL